MANSLSAYRYSSFGLFILCNAVVCCVSVWNLALAQQIGWNPLIDAYMITIGALGILFIFPVLCIDLLRKNSLVGRVWFECIWVGVFWVLQLAGAAAITAILPNLLCSVAADILQPSSCISTKVLLAFAWLGAVNLLVYFCVLMATVIYHMKDDSQVWSGNTRMYPWYRVREALPSGRPEPLRTWSKPPVPAATPQIRLPSDLSRRSSTRSSMFDSEKLSAVPSRTPMTSNKSARILQSAWISATVTPASPPSDGSSEYGTSSSDLTSTPTGIPPSAMYIPYSSTIKPSPLGTGPPPRSSSLSATFGGAPLSAAPSRKGGAIPPSPLVPSVGRKNSSSGPRPKSKRKSTRPPPLDMTRLHSAYGR
ncbi:uncharacterized protein TRAVEDRAFT_45293 [Trametes versicolor FP-101664 SS1]|uniref:uncharacterized protein n=1 Tax=Trametes versicolor (strain FP-101664) TaxID=717944 RepID=UPI00046216AC|nr:uncharacterized protein TRAVEDRAFT_45293 [Trametes versicolor FP-101664 SS1]EIW60036.1 hypothetical protein TRAVEDRAFT_45293 [Trametes versicolor FP-101664 SS1]